jgi:hypothetical protein
MPDLHRILPKLFSELTDGAHDPGKSFILNTGDIGLLASLEKLSAADVSRAVHGGATIAAHAAHVQFGLSLMNLWAKEGGNPFADAKWDDAWKISRVDDAQWAKIQGGLADEARRWKEALGTPRTLNWMELSGMIGSIAHLAYHLGAIRQIEQRARGPKEGTFV